MKRKTPEQEAARKLTRRAKRLLLRPSREQVMATGPTGRAAMRIKDSERISIRNVSTSGFPLYNLAGDGNLSVTITDSSSDGDVVKGRQIDRQSDQHSVSRVTSDVETGTSVTAYVESEPSTKEEQIKAGRNLAASWNERSGTSYEWEHYDDDPPDGFLVSAVPGEARIPVEVTNVDQDLKGALGRAGFIVDRSLDAIHEAVSVSIASKAEVDPDMKPKTVLLLSAPTALGASVRSALSDRAVDSAGYKAVWVCSIGEPAFPIPIIPAEG